MKFTSFAFTSLLSIAFAAPISQRDGKPDPYYLSSVSLRDYKAFDPNNPAANIQYDVTNGTVLHSQEKEVTTIGIFDLPNVYAGHQCQINFVLDYNSKGDGDVLGVWTSIADEGADPLHWPNNYNFREKYLGQITVTEGDFSSETLEQFPCPAGKALAVELVGLSDNTNTVFRRSNIEGPFISVVGN